MLPSEPIEAVVFDLDGLIVNTEDLYIEVGHRLLAPWGLRYEDELRNRMMGQPAREALRLMISWHQLEIELEELIGRSADLVEEMMRDHLAPMPGLYELLDVIEQWELPKAIATSGTRTYAHGVTQRLKIADRFRFVLTCEDITNGKPAPDVYLLAASKLAVPPARVMVLEDSENGCRAAIDAGTFAVAVPSDHSHDHCFDGAAFVAHTLADRRIGEALRFGRKPGEPAQSS